MVAQLDGYANGVKPNAVVRFLRSHGAEVDVVDTYYLARASTRRGSFASKLPRPGLRRLAIYGTELASLLLTRRWSFGRKHLSYHTSLADHRLRQSLLASILPLDDYDLVICEHPQDAGLLRTTTSAQTFYDCPNPWADELYYEKRLTERQREKLRVFESSLWEGVDGLSFSWQSYAWYAVEHYGISGSNLAQLNWGCTPAERRAVFGHPPRIAYIGSLSSRFIDLPLLARLTKLYPHIDVYGGPPPDPSLGLNYLGWAPPEVLEEYQFGLITCTKDEIRRDGFSVKHLDYIAYGLPVLVPAWRRHLELLRGSVPYEESTFVSLIESLSDETAWQRMSDEAYEQATRLTWDRTLEPLLSFVRRR